MLAIIAVGAVSVPFIGSLGPTDRAIDNARQSGRFVDASELAPGTFLEKGNEYSRYFALRDFDGQVRLFSVRHRRGTYWIADLSWERPFSPCDDFGPDAVGDKLIKGGAFRCHDPNSSNWYLKEMVWDYSGKNLGKRTGDMIEARYKVEGDTLFILDEMWPVEEFTNHEE